MGVNKFLGSDSCYEDVVGGIIGDSEEDGIAPLQLRESICLEGFFIVRCRDFELLFPFLSDLTIVDLKSVVESGVVRLSVTPEWVRCAV